MSSDLIWGFDFKYEYINSYITLQYINSYFVLVSEGGALSSWKTADYLFSDDASSEDTQRCI